jgi:outer membrane protein insertion porin family
MPIRSSIVALCVISTLLAGGRSLLGQAVDVANRPVAKVSVEGVKETETQLLLNQIRTKAGDAYDPQIVAGDIQNLTRLGRFARIEARVDQNPDGTINLTYIVTEQKLLSDVQVVGNKNLTDQDLLAPVLLRAGDPRDPFLIERGKEEIRAAYRKEGYFLADVSVDEETLNDTGILILRVREGPRVKVREVGFEGNTVYPDEVLASKIATNSYIWIFRKGVLSKDQLDQDVAKIREYYQDRGYLDVRVGRRIDLSDDQEDARVTFVIDEGRKYTISDIRIVGATLFPEQEIRQAMTLKIGDIYSQDRLRTTQEALADLFGKLGFIETQVFIQRVFHETEPTVDLEVRVRESRQYLVGNVIIRGNELTQDKVVRRQIRGLEPGQPYDRTGLEMTKRKIRETRLIQDSKITILDSPAEETRDMLIEVKEGNTGSLSFGAAVSSDSGVFGAIDLVQRNFDIQDWPDSWGELFSGRAFRGAGQHFSLTLQPGQEFQRYQVSFREPYLLDSDFFLDTSAFFFTRFREKWDEQRVGGSVGIGKRFGDVWSAQVRTRAEIIDITDLEADAPVDAFAVQGDSTIDSVGLTITRSTVDSALFPTQGTRLVAGLERAGVFGTDYEFTRATADFDVFFTLDEDFFGRKTVLSFGINSGYIFEASEAPLFERYYAGGHRTFRGFDFRGVGPRGIRNDTKTLGDDPVGGEWMFLFKTEYNFPIWENVVRGVFFMDSGTVQQDFGFDEYRVAVGAGVRLTLPFLGQAPFAFDLAFPFLKEEGDETRLFSFDVALPF